MCLERRRRWGGSGPIVGPNRSQTAAGSCWKVSGISSFAEVCRLHERFSGEWDWIGSARRPGFYAVLVKVVLYLIRKGRIGMLPVSVLNYAA